MGCTGAQDTRSGRCGKRGICQSLDWAAAASCSRRTLLAPEQAAAENGDGSAFNIIEIWRDEVLIVAVRCGTVPIGTILATFPCLNACVNGRLTVLFLCCCVAAEGY